MEEITKVERATIVAPLSVTDVLRQVSLIQEIMAQAMREGEHYGIIPGCKKPSLLKAGAEKLCLTFRIAPEFKVDTIELRGDHREVRVLTSLKSILNQTFLGQGVGSCSTLESKYRYRKGDPKPTDKTVPKEYWDIRKRDAKAAQALLGGNGFSAKKVNGIWTIMRDAEDKIENPDIADQFNTVLKMAKKRSLVDSVLTATAASDIFTQDVEELAENLKMHEAKDSKPEESKDKKSDMEDDDIPF